MEPPVQVQVLVQVLVLLLMSAKMSDAGVMTVPAGGDVTLPSGLRMERGWDFRWTHPHLLLRSNQTSLWGCQRCKLLSDGSLRINGVDARDAGNYTLQAFNHDGKLKHVEHFLLRVEGRSQSNISRLVAVCSLLLLLFLPLFILRMRRRRRGRDACTPSGQGENVYVVMRGSREMKQQQQQQQEEEEQEEGKPEEVKQQEEEAGVYVSCDPAGSMEEDVYV